MITKLIYRESCPSGDGNIYRCLCDGPMGEKIELTVIFTHYPEGSAASTWVLLQWVHLNGDPSVPINKVLEILGNGDSDAGDDVLHEWLASSVEQAWCQWTEEQLDLELEAAWERTKFDHAQIKNWSRF